MRINRSLNGFHLAMVACLFCVQTNFLVAAEPTPPWEVGSMLPEWSDVPTLRNIKIKYDARASSEKNGQRLFEALNALVPGDRLLIGPGEYTFTRKVTLDLSGTEAAPIFIEALDPENRPVLTRIDANQNLLNIGEQRPTRYLKLQGLELIGGSVGIRFGDCEKIWLNKCEIHHSEHGGITANSHNTSRFYITNNHLHHFESGTGEAMYLGANHSNAIMSYSVIATNHIHDCSGSQGDGIELKQGSHHNWIVGNEVHDTKYPCLITYGTNGNGINVIQRNFLYRSQNQTLQIQGEAIVRNNLIMAAAGDGFSSTDHQSKTRDLHFVHNTIVTTGRGANLSSWGGREGMIFANNAIYSKDNLAVRFPTGCEKVEIAGNVIFGGVQGCTQMEGFVKGNGLSDFRSIDWKATKRIALPTAESKLRNQAAPRFALKIAPDSEDDAIRTTSGAFEYSNFVQ